MRVCGAVLFLSLMAASAQAGGEYLFRFIFTRDIAHAQELIFRGTFDEVQAVIPQARHILRQRQPVPFGHVVLPPAYPLTELPAGRYQVVLGYVSFPAVSHSLRQLDAMEWSMSAMQAIAHSVKKHT